MVVARSRHIIVVGIALPVRHLSRGTPVIIVLRWGRVGKCPRPTTHHGGTDKREDNVRRFYHMRLADDGRRHDDADADDDGGADDPCRDVALFNRLPLQIARRTEIEQLEARNRDQNASQGVYTDHQQ